MFSVRQKREIAEYIQQLLAETNHPELPAHHEIEFHLHVKGAESWSWADIEPNWIYSDSQLGINYWNEIARDTLKENK